MSIDDNEGPDQFLPFKEWRPDSDADVGGDTSNKGLSDEEIQRLLLADGDRLGKEIEKTLPASQARIRQRVQERLAMSRQAKIGLPWFRDISDADDEVAGVALQGIKRAMSEWLIRELGTGTKGLEALVGITLEETWQAFWVNRKKCPEGAAGMNYLKAIAESKLQKNIELQE